VTQPALIAAIGLAVVLAAGWLAATLSERRRRAMQGRLAAVMVASPAQTAGPQGAASLRRQTAGGKEQGFPLLPPRFYQWLLNELRATGDRLGLLSLFIGAGIALLIAAGFLIAVAGFTTPTALSLALGFGIVVSAVRLRMAQRRFQRRFIDIFPDALDVIVRAARAGLPVSDALEAAATTVPNPVSGEFRKLIDELGIGVDLEEALEAAADRIRVNDFRFFAAAIVLQRRTGGSLAETLANLSGLIRKRREIRLKVRALSAETRATAYLLGSLPIIMIGITYMLNPGLMSLLFTDPRGKTVLSIAIGMEVFGFFLMTTMIKRALR
jgi:tight adherence protein B